jgi:hypothetical protein
MDPLGDPEARFRPHGHEDGQIRLVSDHGVFVACHGVADSQTARRRRDWRQTSGRERRAGRQRPASFLALRQGVLVALFVFRRMKGFWEATTGETGGPMMRGEGSACRRVREGQGPKICKQRRGRNTSPRPRSLVSRFSPGLLSFQIQSCPRTVLARRL